MRLKFFCLLSLLFLFSCADNKPKNIVVDPAFSAYISAFTSGVVSSSSAITVALVDPVDGVKPGDELTKDVFDFDPSIEGKAFWVNDRTIEFKPAEKLKSGKAYEAKFDLSKIQKVPEEFKLLTFGFNVINQNMFVAFDGLKSTEDRAIQTLFGTVRTSDIADASNLQACLTAEQNGKKLKLVWEHLESGKTHKYTVKGVKRAEKEGTVTLKWNGDKIGAEIEDTKDVRIPPIGEFTLVQVKTFSVPGVYFSLQFSDKLDPNQDLEGMVYLKRKKKLRLEIEGNEIKAYPIDDLGFSEIITIETGIRNAWGDNLKERYIREIELKSQDPELKLLGNGVIMPSGSGITFPFKAVNLKAINLRILQVYENNVAQFLQVNQLNGNSELARVGRIIYDGQIDLVSSEAIDYGVWNNFSVDLSRLVNPEPGAIYRVMMSFERYQSIYPCASDEALEKPFKRKKLNFDNEQGYFNENYSWYDEDYRWNERDNPCKTAYYMNGDHFISANVFASDFGMICKESSGDTYNLVISDLLSADALRGIEVEAYDYQNNRLASGKTNRDGVVQLNTKSKPYLMVAKKGKQRGYLRVDNGSSLEMSLYDVGGVKVEKGVKGFIYGERGVWRPGDDIYLSFMLEDKENALPDNHPVLMEFYDPMGKLYDKAVQTKSVEGLYAFKLKTTPDDVTGQWQVKFTVGNSKFYKSLKIETVKPNRINIELDKKEIVSSTDNVVKNLKATWLYGAPGANLKTNMELQLGNLKTTFNGFENFQFDDRTKSFYFDDVLIAEATTDAEGKAKLVFDVNKPSDAPGMLKMRFATKVYEQGGDFSQDFLSAKYSPYRSYVGVKLPKSNNWLNALNTENTHNIVIATLDEFGKPISRNVDVELYSMDWNWWWEGSGESEVTRYINRQSANLIKSESVSIANGKSIYQLSFPEAGWGRYMIRVVDRISGHSTSETFYGRYPGWYSQSNEGGSDAASMININQDKPSYNVGDEAEITVPSGGVGNVYISIEKGDKILKQFWVKAEDKNTVIKLPITKDMAPNVYASVFLMQPHGQTENSLPIRMYGVTPIMVVDAKTKLEPVIAAPKSIRPESTYEVKVSEKEGKAMAYTLAMVDEGLLSLTRFKTPNPWDAFYAKEALSVRSWDMYKYVMSAQTGKMASVLAIGGDEALTYKEDAKANRFKPVVRYIGPFYLKANESKTHTLEMSNYIGAVRVMAVAGYEGAYGSAEKEIKVKQPLMVLSTLPRVLGPSEKIRVPINVITTEKNIKNVKIKVSSNGLLKTQGDTEKSIQFSDIGEQTVYFEFDVAKQLGVAKFKVEVSSGKETAFEEVELIVRPPNPPISKSSNSSVNAGESWKQSYSSIGISGTNKTTLQVSKLPNLDLEKHLGYLIRYPHGCIEQTTSSVFPQLYLNSLTKLDATMREKIDENISAALNRYRSFQLSSGGFSYWPGNSSYASEWGTNYAGHFMVEAKNKGYTLPAGVYDEWLKFQKSSAAKWNRNDYDEYGRRGADLTQAYRLYTMALAGSADLGAMNRLRNDNNLSTAAAWRLSAAYALVGRKDVAEDLANRPMSIPNYREMGYTYGSNVRDMAMILESLSTLKVTDRGVDLANDICAELNKGWHSTQTRAYALLALAKFVGGGSFNDEFGFTATINGKTEKVNTNAAVYSFDIGDKKSSTGEISISNTSDQLLFVSLIQEGIPLEVNDTEIQDDITMRIVYRDLQGNALDVTSLPQGTDFKAMVTVSHPGIRSAYKEIALNQIFPSGWQIVSTRVAEDNAAGNKDFKYQDIRDDRVYTYFDLGKGSTKTFEILLNSTFVGKFYQPAVFCAPMYDESIQALKSGRWVEVIDEK